VPSFTLFDDVDELRTVMGGGVAAGDETLTTFLLDAEAAIAAVAGPLGDVVEVRRGGSSFLILDRYVGSIAKVIEGRIQPVELDPTDYVLRGDRRSLERVDAGPNPASRWVDPTEVQYAAANDRETRRVTAIALIRAALTGQPGVLGMTEGNFSIQYANGETWSATRDDVLESVGPLWNFS
jgi:hypothetical protein